MLYIAACGNEASVRKYLKEMEGEYVREDVQILCGDEIEGSGTMPDVLFLSDREAAQAGRRSRKSRRLSLNFSCVPMRG